MEDILDTFLIRVDGDDHQPGSGNVDKGRFERLREKMGKLFSLSKLKARHEIANAIKGIKKQLQEVADRRDRCKVEIVAKPASSSIIDPRLEAMYKEVAQLVGIDGAMGEIISMLSLQRDEVSNDKLKIVSVLGIGGLGKTTLAKAVYDKHKSDFSCGAFVPVGRNPDLKKVFRDILIDLDKRRYTDANILIWDERQLIDELQHFLQSKRYFIVIDDVWETQSWERIRLALVENNRGSRIISTTRKSEVAHGEVYKPNPLSEDNSKMLFYTRLFSGEGKCPNNQVDDMSDKILKKCGGIPLAIITMASLLVGKSRAEWSEVCNSIGFRDKDIKQIDTTMEILSLSYYDLPYHLRACLLYLSAFPEDCIIDKNSLIWRWVAEDFIPKKPGIGLFEVGEGYFNDLVNRSMIQAVQSSESKGIIDGCRVHDMVLDLLRSLSCEENFVTILLDNDEGTSSISNARRLAHQKSTMDAQLDNHKGMEKMRSFIAYRCRDDKELSFHSFKVLRVLNLEHVYMKSWNNARSLENLLHLRYLGLKQTTMPEVPKEIGALKFLQTLDLVENFKITELPLSVGQLTQLVCLRAWGSIDWRTSIPNGILKKLKSLEELLVQCDVGKHGKYYEGQFKELGNLCELRVITIKVIGMNQSMLSDLLHSLGNLHKIQSLKLEHHNVCSSLCNATFDAVALPQHLRHLLVGVHSFSKFPSCINPSCVITLSHLELQVNTMDEQSMQILAQLPELHHLTLSTKSTVTVTNIAVDGWFHKLRVCRLYSSMVLFVLNEDSSVSFTIWDGRGDHEVVFGSRKKDERVRAPTTVMPSLQELSVKLEGISIMKCQGNYGNLGLEYLTSLKKVTVSIDCDFFWYEAWVIEAEAGLKHAVHVHPNHPTLVLRRFNEDKGQQLLSRLRSFRRLIGSVQGEVHDTDADAAIEEQDMASRSGGEGDTR